MGLVDRAAEEALAAYGLGDARIVDSRVGAMRYVGATIHKLRAVGQDGASYLVSVNEPYDGVEMATRVEFIRSHLLWLESLAHGTNLTVQTPVRNGDGEFVTLVRGSGDDPEVACTVVEWIAGEGLPDCGDELPPAHVAEQMGRILARVHTHAAEWAIPTSFDRPIHDEARIRRSFGRLRVFVDSGKLTQESYERLMAAKAPVLQMANALGHSRPVWGLGHGDFHNANCVIHDGKLRPIDFDFCYVGHYMRDVAYAFTLMTIHLDARDTEVRTAFWAGYKGVRAVSDAERDALEAYFVEVGVDFWGERPYDDSAAGELATLAESPCRALLGGRRHLTV